MTAVTPPDWKDDLAALLWANVPIIAAVTFEEGRVVKALLDVEGGERLGVTSWDLADGFHTVREGKAPFHHKECTTETVLAHIAEKAPGGHVFVLRDFHHAWQHKKGYVTRKLRNMVPALRARSQYIVLTMPEAEIPVELRDDVVVLEVPLPGEEELRRIFDEATAKLDAPALPAEAVKDKLVSSALGLTTNQARLAFSRVFARFGRFDERGIDLVTWQKRQAIREAGALEFWPAEEGEADVGGLDLMKAWLKKRATAFGPEARAARVPFPRGVALIGVPGTGKSLSAKMLSGLWRLPLLRLDVGALFGSLLGESEGNMRKAIRLAETVSPCILWIDELEKAFAGSSASSGPLTSGAAARVFGTFLTWMQEHRSPVFVLATANDVEGLPPELLARFDRTFFLDLPTYGERREIFAIHLKRAGEAFPERRFRLDELAEKTCGFVGREIERVVREAQFTALADENREMETGDILAAVAETVPLQKSHGRAIEEIRRWKLEGRAFPASRGAGREGEREP
jgi:SpoVK/Ycf46/Vps4 family AAA+-type ATPase